MTFDEYFKAVNGKGIDYDGMYNVQCFDLANDYAVKVLGCKPFIGMYAYEIYTNFAAQPSAARFTKIANTPDFIPKKGDIMVWAKSLNGTAGHVAVCTGEGTTSYFYSYDQNWNGRNDPCTKIKHDYSHVLGVLRPKEQTNITAKAAETLKIKGIDVSQWQGVIDFEKVKADGVKFVIIRVNNWDGLNNRVVKDTFFEQNYKAAKAAGLDVGAYYYTWECSVSGAMRDAELCLNYIQGKKFEYPIYFDLEWNKAFQQGRTVCDGMVKAFCDMLESGGYFAGLYISRSPLQTYISQDVANRYSLWIAEYGSECKYNGLYGMWQYSSTGKVNGISGDVDLDECYVDYPALIKSGGFNGYPKPAAKEDTALKPLDTDGFKRGDKSLGVYYLKRRLAALGFTVDDTQGFGGGTEKAVNSLLKKWGYKENGIAGEKFAEFVMR